MPIAVLFPTQIYRACLPPKQAKSLNAQLLREIHQLQHDDRAGRRWSAQSYPGGYTSYGSANRMHQVSPTFARLERLMARHLTAFAKALEFDVEARPLVMTDCWVNVMPHRVAHTLHLHPLSSVSGTYYVRVPAGAPGLKVEDPRLSRMMAAPPRRADAAPYNRPWVTLPAQSGDLLLFESWLRHEVPANRSRTQRVSVSFNYSWF